MKREELLDLDVASTELHDFLNSSPDEVDRLIPEVPDWSARFRMHALTGTQKTISRLVEDWKSFHPVVKLACWNRTMTSNDLRMAKALHQMCADDILKMFVYSLPNPDIT